MLILVHSKLGHLFVEFESCYEHHINCPSRYTTRSDPQSSYRCTTSRTVLYWILMFLLPFPLDFLLYVPRKEIQTAGGTRYVTGDTWHSPKHDQLQSRTRVSTKSNLKSVEHLQESQRGGRNWQPLESRFTFEPPWGATWIASTHVETQRWKVIRMGFIWELLVKGECGS